MTNHHPTWAQQARDLYTHLTRYTPGRLFEEALSDTSATDPVQFVAGFCDPIIVSRHPAAVEFIRATWPEMAEAEVMTGNVTPDDVRGRIVVGNIPMAIACEAIAVVAVEFEGMPPRGAEYSAADMVAAGARLRLYQVKNWVGFARPEPVTMPDARPNIFGE